MKAFIKSLTNPSSIFSAAPQLQETASAATVALATSQSPGHNRSVNNRAYRASDKMVFKTQTSKLGGQLQYPKSVKLLNI